ncbi:hypothetical protein B0H67DRAFT_640923 [Lasiosphaeris hirsuta]|uniref:Extracellular protein n=1 Tax=Lasiosphaeris hirsuta TaxID=260670 RepID=A0AA40E1E7_9PEZI|nr:hypothetical protein B0H67DRAFT_640923 [Lasiosphaeris hirsuta]
MKIHWTAALLTICVYTTSAYWVRGAAERALYYCVYVLEDIDFSQTAYDGWKIAGDCVSKVTETFNKFYAGAQKATEVIPSPSQNPFVSLDKVM